MKKNAAMDEHIGYDKNSRESKIYLNRRKGYGENKIQGSFYEYDIRVPKDR